MRSLVAESTLTVTDGAVTSAKILDGTINRVDVGAAFKAPYADTADYAKAAFPGADGFTDDGAVVRLTTPTDKVGIGTASPTKQLDVTGSVGVSDTIYANKVKIADGTQGSGKILTSDASGVANWTAPGQAGFPSGSEGQVMRYNGTDWQASGDVSIDTSGQVGIGTSNPSRKLEVIGNARVSDTLFASNVSSNSPLQLQTDGVTRVFVDDSAGLVGVGTLTPAHRLDVSGSAAVSDTFYGNKVKIADGTQGDGKILTSDANGVANWMAPGQAGFPSGSDGQMMRYNGSAWEASDAVYSDSSRKIGIGTTVPQRMLTVIDTSTEADRQVTELAHGADVNFRLVTMNGEASNVYGTPMVKMGMVYGNPGTSLISSLIRFHRGSSGSDGAISFSTLNDQERMRIASNGNVGIGTTLPYNKLDVEGSAVIGTGYSGSYYAPANGLLVQGNVGIGTTYAPYPLSVNGSGYVTGNLGIGTTYAPYPLSVSGSGYVTGNLGIGTTSPSYRLDVLGGMRSTGGYTIFNTTYDNSSGNMAVGFYGFSDCKLAVVSNQTASLYSSNSGGTWAGYFVGNVNVTGTLSKGGGWFKIDHPLDPDNKWLYHSFVESPDMMNVYNGNVVTDASGKATIDLPDYFEALNRDFRYQLTVIGQFAQAMVETKIDGNRFVIRTDKPNVEVSWQVTGIRHDPFADAHRVGPVVDKTSEERGKYLYPKELGKPESMRMGPVGQPVEKQGDQ
jgi:hypothetical protein